MESKLKLKTMNANELRIGNYITDIHSEKGYWQVKELHKNKAYYGEYFSIKYKNIQPIPLTEEWLLKFGFDDNYNDSYSCYLNDNLVFDLVALQFSYSITIQGTTLHRPNIKHVHQLQNLYFALTGKELEIKIDK